MEIPLLYDIVIIFGLAIVVLYLCHRFHIPTVVGLLLTGILVGPYGFGLVQAIHEVEVMAEIGIVLLLFTIGIEFSLENLLRIRKSVLLGGFIQVFLTILSSFALVQIIGTAFNKSLFIGFLVALSSTAIVLKLFQEKGEVDSPHGRSALGILIFQDIIIVPMILITPLLAGTTTSMGESVILLLAKALGIILIVVISTKWIVPNVLFQITKTRNQEIFLMSIVVIGLGIAWLTSMAGLSLALGAFLAGLIISESKYSHQALGNILPFRDVFLSFFFVSIGMLLDIGFLVQNLGLVLLITLLVLVSKFLIAGFATTILGFPLRTAIMVGLALSQVGEFSFILSRIGLDHGLLSQNMYQIFLSCSVLTMAATPFLMISAPHFTDLILKLHIPKRLVAGFFPVSENTIEDLTDHLVIIGFGLNGKNVARAARVSGIPYTVIETNPETVRNEQARGEPIHYGDASQEMVLQHANIQNARIVVVAINDPAMTRRITETLRRLNPNVHLIIRSRYLSEMKPLYDLGASEVIPEEFETSIEIFTHVLAKYLVPRDQIESLIAEIRSDSYEMFRGPIKDVLSVNDIHLQLPNIEIGTLSLKEDSFLVGKSLAEAALRSKYEVTVLAIQRDGRLVFNPKVDLAFQVNDMLFVLGTPAQVAEVARLTQSS